MLLRAVLEPKQTPGIDATQSWLRKKIPEKDNSTGTITPVHEREL
jgi:hypothetical protein